VAAEPAAQAGQGTRRHPVGGQPDQEHGSALPDFPLLLLDYRANGVSRAFGWPAEQLDEGRATSKSPASNRTTLPVGSAPEHQLEPGQDHGPDAKGLLAHFLAERMTRKARGP
jgi:hypothetical protein